MADIPVKLPAGYAPAQALGMTDAAGNLALIGPGQALPVAVQEPEPPAPLAGSTSSDTLAGPFTPLANRPVLLQLAGIWQGTAALLRSHDGGASLAPLTVGGLPWGEFSANACEPVWTESEAGISLFLDIRIDSGTLAYRVSQ